MVCRKLKRIGLNRAKNLIFLFMSILITFSLVIALTVTNDNPSFDDIPKAGRQPLRANVYTLVTPNHRQFRSSPTFQAEDIDRSAHLISKIQFDRGHSTGRLTMKYIYNMIVKGTNIGKFSPEVNPLLSVGLQERSKKLPQTIIIGVRKCGTRALINMLSMHPDIVCPSDEIHFFDFDANYAKGIPWYLNQMPLSSERQITIEKTPAYFTSKKSPERVRHMNSSIKILLIVRQPTTRVFSDYIQGVIKHSRKAIKDFSELVMESGEINKFYKPIQTSIYCVHLARWLHYFNRTQIHVVDGDALISNPYKEVKLVEQFLGISYFYSEDNFYFNKTKGYYCLRWGNESRCLGANKGRRSIYPNVSEPLVSRLNEFFGPYNEIFYKQTEQRFKWENST